MTRHCMTKVVVKALLLLVVSSELVDGSWTEWTDWSSCTITCGDGGYTTRTRTCIEDETPCYGDNLIGEVCNMDPCSVDGVWLEWGVWSNCTLPCGSGSRFRQRDCQQPLHGGLPCPGEHNVTEACNVDPCPVNGNLTQWSDWYPCPVSCGGSTQVRNRTCVGPFHGGQPCEGALQEDRECNPHPCPIDGSWSDWSDWSECSVTCNYGVNTRRRSCDNPVPQHGGALCSGQSRETRTCYPFICPRDGGWSPWSPWTACSSLCGWGLRQRQRACTNPLPAYGGLDCVGSETGGESCIVTPCPVDAGWGAWGDWGNCSKSCGSGGNHTRTRPCDSPPALHGGRDCPGSNWTVAECYVDRCQEDGGWSEWGDWGGCSKPCETGAQVRNRTCNAPPPTPPTGEECRGAANDSRLCNTHICPVHGGWSVWSPWTLCPVTCGGDIETRYRRCDNPPPLFSGDACPGSPDEERDCSTDGCPVDGAWSQWSPWQDCSTSCGGGETSRSRRCDSPETAWGGTPCPSTEPDQEWKDCNMFPCPIPGGWSQWSVWPECPVTCGGQELSRMRYCDAPAPQHGGQDCPGDAMETHVCNQHPCPVNGSWTAWSEWSECSMSCEGGIQARQRTCADPPAAHGGALCPGNWTKEEEDEGEVQAEVEGRDCNSQRCPIHGGFTQWTDWPPCPVSCGGAAIHRHRNCSNPMPQFGGLDCQGTNESMTVCNGDVQCPIHGDWGRWLDWAPCTRQCESGTTSRIRLCNNPSPLYGGDRCQGDMQEMDVCNTHKCPVHGGFSLWTQWSACTKSCGGGQTQRTRLCDSPAPSFGGNPCSGPTIQKRLCSAFYCPIHGGFSEWGEWTVCPVTCGGAVVNRTRTCNSPSPRHGGRPCDGALGASSLCAGNPCPVDGAWTVWAAWSNCSSPCGSGREARSRHCTNPAPAHAGTVCPGEGYREVVCYHQDQCPVLPSQPTSLNFSAAVTRDGQVTVYIKWDSADIDETDYFVVQAKRLPTAGVARGNASAYDWWPFGTVMGQHRQVPLRGADQSAVQLFRADFAVRVVAHNQHGEAESLEETFNVAKYLLGGSVHCPCSDSAPLMLLLAATSYLLSSL